VKIVAERRDVSGCHASGSDGMARSVSSCRSCVIRVLPSRSVQFASMAANAALATSRVARTVGVDDRVHPPVCGTVVGIFTAPAKGAPPIGRDAVRAVAGRGLEGDRYFHTYQGDHDPAADITLIEAGLLSAATSEHGVDLDAGQHRRNVVIDGINLLEVLGRTIKIADVVEVLAHNPPCRYLQELTGEPMLQALRRRGGVRGHISVSGIIRLGDSVRTYL
jgi:MOSC domain-containing protein YiiM